MEEGEGGFKCVGGRRREGQCVLAHKAQTDKKKGKTGMWTYRMMASTLMAAFSSFCCASRLATSRWATLLLSCAKRREGGREGASALQMGLSFSSQVSLPHYVLDGRRLLVGGNLDTLHGHLQIRLDLIDIKGFPTLEKGRHAGAWEGRGLGQRGLRGCGEWLGWHRNDAPARVLGLRASSCSCVGV